MKKMMMMVAAALCVSLAQAVSVNWNISGLKVANVDNTMSAVNLSGAIVYAFVGDSSVASAAATAAGNGTFGTWLSGIAAADQLGTALTTTGGAALKSGQGSFSVGQSVSVFLVAFDAATYGAANNYLITSIYTQTMPSTNPTYTFGAPGGTYVPSTWTDVVPEPTSMALLALGAAAIGLRRKFRK